MMAMAMAIAMATTTKNKTAKRTRAALAGTCALLFASSAALASAQDV